MSARLAGTWYRGEDFKFGFAVTEGDPSAIASAVAAAKPSTLGAVPDESVAAVFNVAGTPRAATGSVPAGYDFVRPAADTASIPAGIYCIQFKLTFTNGGIGKEDHFFMRIENAVVS